VEDLIMYFRSLALRCATCIWYVPPPKEAGVALGACRRSAPGLRGWPPVIPSDWCGDHVLDELAQAPAPLPLGDDPDGDGVSGPLHDPTDCRYCQEQAGGGPFAPED
jgi:hypothetical protein